MEVAGAKRHRRASPRGWRAGTRANQLLRRTEAAPRSTSSACAAKKFRVILRLMKQRRKKRSSVREESPQYGQKNGQRNKFRFIDLFCGIGGFRKPFCI